MKVWLHSTLALLSFALIAAGQKVTTEPTAFTLAKAGNAFISPQAKDNVVEMRSLRTQGKLVPDVWCVDYYDPTAFLKTVEVKFISGQMARITRPKSFFKLMLGTKKLGWRKLRIDSDKALSIALTQPQLAKTTLYATEFNLGRSPTDPIWKIRFWAIPLGKPDKVEKVGQITLSAYDGHIVKNDLRGVKD